MGAWGIGPFENDDALDLVGDLADDPSAVEDLLPDPEESYVEVDQGAAVIALAHMVSGTTLPEGVAEEQFEPLRTPEFRQRLRAAMNQVFSSAEESELYELWEEGDEFEQWKSASWVEL